MKKLHSDYVITASTYPGENSGIEAIAEAGAKLIFVHGMISDNKGKILLNLLDEISDRGIIPGIATHDPIPTIEYCVQNSLNVKAFLIPFNATGAFMGNQQRLEETVNNTKDYDYISMKTLASGKINPEIAFEYISNHNISAVTIGMVTPKEAMESTSIALKFLKDK
ncbi:MAG: hypothetical protein ACFFA0_03840 [Promethearchaeota archaeon]